MQAQNLKHSVIQILDASGTIQGTGFIIDSHTAVTCAHVVTAAGATPGDSLTVAYASNGQTCSTVVMSDFWCSPELDDIAILQLQSEPPSQVLPLTLGSSQQTSNHSFYAFGYPQVGDIQGVWAQGTILGTITNGSGLSMLQIRAQEIVEGMSGAPVFDTHTDRVVGMVTATYYPANGSQKLRDVAFATPIEAILQTYPHIKLAPPRPETQTDISINQAPPLPLHFVPRPEITDSVKQRLLDNNPVTPGMVPYSALLGLGGIGKSTVAAALAYDSDVQHRFGDGIFWATVGQEPDLLNVLVNWIHALGNYDFNPTSIDTASNHLKNLLQHKSVLLILDDVWDAEHIEPLAVCCCHGHILVTTRRFDVAEEPGAAIFQLEVMSPAQTLNLLATKMNRELNDAERGDALRLAEAVGFLPLALELAAARVARGTPWSALRQALEKEVAQLEALEAPRRRRREKSQVEASFNLSLKALQDDDEETRQAFIWLGILPEDVQITAPMVTTIWQTDAVKAADTLEILWNDALLLPGAPVWLDGQEWPSYRLHDLLRDIARRLLTMPEPNGLGLSLPAVHATLLERYKKRTKGSQWHTLPDDGYIHTYLAWHLEQAGQLDQIHLLLSEETPAGRNGWFHAREQLGQLSGYLADVNLASRLLQRQNLPQETVIGLQLRYALITASLNSLARNIPFSLLTALVEKKLWTPAQGLTYAHQLRNFEDQARALIELSHTMAPGAKTSIVNKAIDVALQITDSWQQTETLMALAERLAEFGQIDHALGVICEIKNEHWQAEALTRLIPHSSKIDLLQVLAAARAIDEEEQRAEVFSELIPHLLPPTQLEVMQETLAAAKNMSDEEQIAEFLAKLAPCFPQDLLMQALEIAHGIEWEGARAELLAELAPFLPDPLREQTLIEAIAITKYIQFDELRRQILVSLAPHLPEKLITRAMASAWLIKSAKTRAKALAQLAPYLPAELQAKAYHEIQTVVENATDRVNQVSLAALLAPYLTPQQKSHVLQTALKSVKLVPQHWKRADLLAALVPHLPAPLLTETLAIAKSIQDTEGQTANLCHIAIKMADCNQHTTALATAREIKSAWPRAKTLASLAPQLAPELRRAVLQEALEITQTINNEVEQAAALTQLAPQLAELGYPEAALEAVQNIWYEQWQVRALASIASHLPEAQLVEALQLTQTIKDGANRTEALVGLAPHLAEPLLLNALHSVQSIHDGQRRAEALLGLIPHLPEPAKLKALRGMLTAVRLGWDQPKQLHVLADLAPQLPVSLRTETMQQLNGTIWQINNEIEQAGVLARLAPYLPHSDHARALETLQAMHNDAARVDGLVGLAPYFSPRQLTQALKIAATTPNEIQRARALVELLPCLSPLHFEPLLEAIPAFQNEAQKAHVLAHITPYAPDYLLAPIDQLAQTIQDQWRRSEIQVELSLRYGQTGRPEKALHTARATWDNVKRAIVLAQLYPHLPPPLNAQALDDALSAYKNIWYAKWQAEVLAELTPHLAEEDRLPLLRNLLNTIAALPDERKRAEALGQILPYLSGKLLPDAMTIINSIHHRPSQVELLAQLIPATPAALQADLLAAIRQLDDTPARALLQAKLALYLPSPHADQLLKETQTLIWSAENRDELDAILAEIVPILAQLPPEQLHQIWQEMLPHLYQRQRKNLLTDVKTLEPIILSLGGTESMAEISRTIQDVGRWWP